MEMNRGEGRKKRIIVGITVLILFLILAVFWILPRPVLKEGASADRVIYSVNVILSPYSHRNDIYLTEENAGSESEVYDTNAYTVGSLDDEIQNRLESVLQTYEMRRTIRYERHLRTYNIVRIGIDVKPTSMEIYAGEDETLVCCGWFWYRVTEPKEFYLEIKSLLDDYIVASEQ